MSIKISRLAIYCCFLLLYKCANRGITSGGEKDVTPPKIIKEVPENFSTNFKSDEIKIYFDEYIKLKEIDYLSIDTEGSEFEILKSVDLDKYKFKFISVEHNYSKNREEIYHLLTDKGYKRIMTNISKWDDYYVNTE